MQPQFLFRAMGHTFVMDPLSFGLIYTANTGFGYGISKQLQLKVYVCSSPSKLYSDKETPHPIAILFSEQVYDILFQMLLMFNHRYFQ